MITCFFGLPRSGKSTMLAKIAVNELRRIQKGKSPYKRVLSNYYIAGCEKFTFEQIGKVDMSDSLILIDEITLDADSRDFKNFSYELKQFFILHGHYGIDIVYATQQYDGVDRKIRELTHNLYYMKKAGQLTYATAIYRHITITEESEIKMGYIFPTLLKIIFDFRHNVEICWRPKYYRYFDSFEAPPMKKVEFKPWSAQKSEYHIRVQLRLLPRAIMDCIQYSIETHRMKRRIKEILGKDCFKKKRKKTARSLIERAGRADERRSHRVR